MLYSTSNCNLHDKNNEVSSIYILCWCFCQCSLLHFSSMLSMLQVKVRDGGTDWGWGVVVNVVKKPSAALGTLPSALASLRGSSYIVDTLLHCSPGLSENGSRPKPCPPRPGEKGEMHVVSWSSWEAPILSGLVHISYQLGHLSSHTAQHEIHRFDLL